MTYSVGRYVYGLAAICFGIYAFTYHDVSNWIQIKALTGLAHNVIFVYMVATTELLGGVTLAWRRTERAGALVLGSMYFIFALVRVTFVVTQPLVYNSYGNFFALFPFVAGAMLLYSPKWEKVGYYSFAICVVSFGLEQFFYLSETASFVPRWIPPGQMFWAITTTAAFFLSAIALLTGFRARLASVLNTVMLLSFGVLVWVPALLNDPHSFSGWNEGLTALGSAGAAWIVVDFLRQRHQVIV